MELLNDEYDRKKKIVLKILVSLFDDWDMARPIYNVVDSSEVTPELIDTLIEMIDMSFKTMDEEDKKQSMIDSIDKLKTIKSEEINSSNKESEEANLILSQNIF